MPERFRISILLLVALLAARSGIAEKTSKPATPASPYVLAKMAASKSIFVGMESEDQSYVRVGEPLHLGYAMLVQAVQLWGYKLADSPAHSDLSMLIAGHAKDYGHETPKVSLSLQVIDSQTGELMWRDEVPLGKIHWIYTRKLTAKDFFEAMTDLLGPLHANPIAGVHEVLEPMPTQLLQANKVWVEPHKSMQGPSGEEHRDYATVLRQTLQGGAYTLAFRRQDADIVLQLWWNESFDLSDKGRVAGRPEFVLTVSDPKTRITLWTFRRRVNPRAYPYRDVPLEELNDANELLSDMRAAIAVGR